MVDYPATWQLHDREKGKAASILQPVGKDVFAAMWDIDRRANPGKRSVEALRDGLLASLQAKMKAFKLKDKGAFDTPDGRHAAYVTYAYELAGLKVIERQVIFQDGKDFVTVASEVASEAEWDRLAGQLEKVTRSLRFPK